MFRELLNLHRSGNTVLQMTQTALGAIKLRGEPTMLQLEVTSRCNFRCSYCIVHNGSGEEQTRDTSEDMFREILRTFPHALYLHLQGQGEPLLNPNLPSMIRYAKGQGRLVGTVTNGSLWTETLTRNLLNTGIDAVAFSLDLAAKKTVERDRSGMDYDQVIAKLNRAIRFRDALGSTTLLGVSCVLKSKTPWNEITAAIHFLDSLGVDFLMIGPLAGTPSYQGRYPNGLNEDRTSKELLAHVMRIRTQCRKLTTPRVDTFAGQCIWAWGAALYINADGSVAHCANNHRLTVAPRFAREIANLPCFRELRKTFIAGETPSACVGCQYLLAHSETTKRGKLPVL